ncbi:MAG: copper chaperone PCu(A)C [Balneolaceae bacterium]
MKHTRVYNYQSGLIVLLLSVFVLFSCEEKAESQKAELTVTNSIEVTDGWARPGKSGMMTAAYFTISNGTNQADTLIGVSTDVTENAQIHRSYETEDGLMGMEHQPFVPISSGTHVEFKPGGLHIMIIQPTMDLNEGDSLLLGLIFSSTKTEKIKVPIQQSGN